MSSILLDTMPIIIGLPGIGKTSVNRAIAELLGVAVVVTDEHFRRLRAIPADSTDPDSEMMRRFVAQAKKDFPNHPRLDELIEAAHTDPTDPKGRAKLHDSTYFRTFGEDVFRTFEWVMNHYLHEQGMFQNAVADITSSAPLYKQNHELFSPKQGYEVFLLDGQTALIAEFLLRDFRQHQALSVRAGENKPIRGAYEAFAKAKAATMLGGTASDANILTAMTEISEKHRAERMHHFAAMATHRVLVPSRPYRHGNGIWTSTPRATPQDIANQIVNTLRHR